LAPGNRCELRILFELGGTFSTLLSFQYEDGPGGPLERIDLDLRGHVTGRAYLTVSGASGPDFCDTSCVVDFGLHAKGTVAAHTFTVVNTGDAATSAVHIAPLVAPFTVLPNGNSCTNGLAPGQSCTFDIAFAPASPGGFAADVVVSWAVAPGYADRATHRITEGRAR
jgi:hypothetical protein